MFSPIRVAILPRRLSELSAQFALCALALLVEGLVGYPPALFATIGHPVTWMGRLLAWLDRHLNLDVDTFARRRLLGALALAALLGATILAAAAVAGLLGALLPGTLATVPAAVLASSCLAQRSLDDHVRRVAEALENEGIDAAREAVGAIVGRDTTRLDEAGVSRAAIESLAENFADGVVAPTFWLALLGLPGGFAYKAINTADSMIGHRSPRHEAFGFAAAKLDDLANWVPARLAGGLLIAAAALIPSASPNAAWRVMLRDARGHPSPNAGWPEAAMAGALGLRLGGPRAYAGRVVEDAFIGDGGRRLDASAIRAALRLYRVACGVLIAAVAVFWLIIARWF